nr:MAG TPA: hypothetical protein [Microviridae sp.]
MKEEQAKKITRLRKPQTLHARKKKAGVLNNIPAFSSPKSAVRM